MNTVEKNTCLSRICNQLASDIVPVYQRPSVSPSSVQGIVKQLQMYHDKYQNIMRWHKSRWESAYFKEKVRAFVLLFDFSSCKCVDFANCNCAKEKQVPQTEQSFFSDQWDPRRRFIGSIDVKNQKKTFQKVQHLKL